MIFLIILFLIMIVLSCLCFLWTALIVSKSSEEKEGDHEENYFSNTTDIDSDFWNE